MLYNTYLAEELSKSQEKTKKAILKKYKRTNEEISKNANISIDRISAWWDTIFESCGFNKLFIEFIFYNAVIVYNTFTTYVPPYNVIDYVKEMNEEHGGNLSTILKNSDGNFKNANNITMDAEDWHDNFKATDIPIYNEDGLILKRYGDGYYWIDLETTNCPDEGTAMGHCGRAFGDTIISLRYKKKPVVTIDATDIEHGRGNKKNYRTLVQIRGKLNQKPEKQYWPYILDFIETMGVTSLKYNSYKKHDNFELSDLPENEYQDFIKRNPQITSTENIFDKFANLSTLPITDPIFMHCTVYGKNQYKTEIELHSFIDNFQSILYNSTLMDTFYEILKGTFKIESEEIMWSLENNNETVVIDIIKEFNLCNDRTIDSFLYFLQQVNLTDKEHLTNDEFYDILHDIFIVNTDYYSRQLKMFIRNAFVDMLSDSYQEIPFELRAAADDLIENIGIVNYSISDNLIQIIINGNFLENEFNELISVYDADNIDLSFDTLYELYTGGINQLQDYNIILDSRNNDIEQVFERYSNEYSLNELNDTIANDTTRMRDLFSQALYDRL